MKHKFLSLIAGLALALSFAGVASAHHVISLIGTVDCQGNYDINVSANVFGQTSLITTLNGDVIGTETPGGGTGESDNYGNHDFEYTGTGASAGDPITAKVSDSESVTNAVLVLNVQSCATPTPPPTPTPTPPCGVQEVGDNDEVYATPVPCPSASIPVKTPRPSLPNITPPPTSTDATTAAFAPSLGWFFLLGATGFLVLIVILTTRNARSN